MLIISIFFAIAYGVPAIFVWGLIGIPATYVGYKRYRSPDICEGYTRNDLMLRALIFPGYVQIKVQNRTSGYVEVAIFTMSACFFILSMPFLFEDSLYLVSVGTLMLIYSIIFLLFLMFWSSLEVNEYCNNMKMPHEGKSFEMFTTKNRQIMAVLLILLILILICTTWWLKDYEGVFDVFF